MGREEECLLQQYVTLYVNVKVRNRRELEEQRKDKKTHIDPLPPVGRSEHFSPSYKAFAALALCLDLASRTPIPLGLHALHDHLQTEKKTTYSTPANVSVCEL